MRRMPLWVAAGLLFCWPAVALAAPSTAADSAYGDYRIPAHRWWQWSAGVSGSFNHQDQSISPDRFYRTGTFRGQLSTLASGGSDSDPLFQTWTFQARVDGDRRHEDRSEADLFGEIAGESSSRFLTESVILDYGVRAYPWRFPLALAASTTQRLAFSQFFSSSDFQRTTPVTLEKSLSSTARGNWSYIADLSIGTGVGRVRDATPVHEAQVLEERLLETGTLSRPLTRSARERLAVLFTTRGRFVFAHSRPDKYFWEEIERVLSEDGALANGALTLYDAHRILEPVTIRGRVLRAAGFFVGPSVVLTSRQEHSGEEFSGSLAVYQADTLFFASGGESRTDSYAREDVIQTALVAEYHHPAGTRWQYDAAHATRLGESGVPMNSFTNGSVTWFVTDRWFATGFLGHSIEWSGHGTERGVEQWQVQVGAELNYFLEDAWAITLRAREAQAHQDLGFFRFGDYSIGISHVISGLFEAPGVVNAMRPIPGGR